jgi:hypothetical protein
MIEICFSFFVVWAIFLLPALILNFYILAIEKETILACICFSLLLTILWPLLVADIVYEAARKHIVRANRGK